jgi:hemerythrin superfamily protein
MAKSEAKDALELLKRDHQQVDKLLQAYEDEGRDATERMKAARSALLMLEVHARIEEDRFYPEVKRSLSDDERHRVFEALEEHRLLKQLVSELQIIDARDPDQADFSAKFKVLCDMVRHHVEEEEQELFPLVEEACSESALVKLGQQLASEKEDLMGTFAGAGR